MEDRSVSGSKLAVRNIVSLEKSQLDYQNVFGGLIYFMTGTRVDSAFTVRKQVRFVSHIRWRTGMLINVYCNTITGLVI